MIHFDTRSVELFFTHLTDFLLLVALYFQNRTNNSMLRSLESLNRVCDCHNKAIKIIVDTAFPVVDLEEASNADPSPR